MAILDLDAVRLAFRDRAVLRGIDLSVERGEVVGVMGANGVGKSTLLRVAAGLLRPGTGAARVLGVPAIRARRRSAIGWEPGADGGFMRRLSLRANLTTSARLAGLGRHEADRRVRRLAGVLGFAPCLDLAAELCSTGTRQRAALARPLLHEPPLVLLDEPLRGIDPAGRAALREALRSECRGRAVVWVSHSADELAGLAGRVLWLERGRLHAPALAGVAAC